MRSKADVVIIGAGVIGCSTAYHLAKLGITEVVVLEMGEAGSGTTSKSASMLSLQFPGDELLARMALYAYDRYMTFEEELGAPIDFRKIGWLFLATSETAEDLRNRARALRSLGIPTELLTPEEARAIYPELRVDDLEAATWGPDDGPVDPHMILWGYLNRAREQGVELCEGVRATGITLQRGRVAGVMTTEGPLAAGVVINAGGPWATEIGRWAGIEIPLRNTARTVVVTGATPEIPSERPFAEDLTAEWYIRPEGDGVLMAMGKRPVEDLNVGLDRAMVDDIIEVAVHRVPLLEKAELRTAWTGVRPLTPDGRPILGRVAEVEDLILNCGWGGMGIIQSPVAGQLIAELVAHGRAATFDLAPLALDRFETQG